MFLSLSFFTTSILLINRKTPASSKDEADARGTTFVEYGEGFRCIPLGLP